MPLVWRIKKASSTIFRNQTFFSFQDFSLFCHVLTPLWKWIDHLITLLKNKTHLTRVSKSSRRLRILQRSSFPLITVQKGRAPLRKRWPTALQAWSGGSHGGAPVDQPLLLPRKQPLVPPRNHCRLLQPRSRASGHWARSTVTPLREVSVKHPDLQERQVWAVASPNLFNLSRESLNPGGLLLPRSRKMSDQKSSPMFVRILKQNPQGQMPHSKPPHSHSDCLLTTANRLKKIQRLVLNLNPQRCYVPPTCCLTNIDRRCRRRGTILQAWLRLGRTIQAAASLKGWVESQAVFMRKCLRSIPERWTRVFWINIM